MRGNVPHATTKGECLYAQGDAITISWVSVTSKIAEEEISLYTLRLSSTRLRWFGYLGRPNGSLLNGVEEVRTGGRQLVGRPKIKWRACLTEDMNTLGIKEHMAHDCQLWQAVITYLALL